MAASMEIMERTTRRFRRPEFGITGLTIGGRKIAVTETAILTKPFCRLLHFRKEAAKRPVKPQPKLLMVAPMSGHFATLLRGTVEALLPHAEVYVTDWIARFRSPKAVSTSTIISTICSRCWPCSDRGRM
jgi:poly(3-hydroxybutyrate) depolymerase